MLAKHTYNPPTADITKEDFGLVGNWLMRQSDNRRARQSEKSAANEYLSYDAALARVDAQHNFASRAEAARNEAKAQGLCVRKMAGWQLVGELENASTDRLLQWYENLQACKG